MKMKKDAVIEGQYRYSLTRVWDDKLPKVMFIGLNPSTADALEDDPTLRRCIHYAQDWGYGGLIMANLFAYRATRPKDMKKSDDPVGPKNDQYLIEISNSVALKIACWGNDGHFKKRSTVVKKMINALHCLKLNRSGEPTHPLYLKKELKPINYT